MRLKISTYIVAAITVLTAQSGLAADMPAKAPIVKAPVAVATPWTGFYVNGGFGYGMWAADTDVFDPSISGCITCVTQVQGGKGWLGTIGAGYDYQFTNRIVAGAFGDATISSLKGTVQDGQPFFAGDIKQTSSWAAGARVGWLASPKTLGYVNAGYTGARFSSATLVNTGTFAPVNLATPATTFNGWFLGGGVESTLDVLGSGWFWRAEYRYSYYGKKDLPELSPGGVVDHIISFKPMVQTVTGQLVYKFNGGLPAPAYPSTPLMATNWTGFYGNAGMGYGLWAADTTTFSPATGLCLLCFTQVQGGKGYLGVIGAGYDWQFAPAWVAGVFGDVDISSLKGTIQDDWASGPVALTGDIKQTSAWAVGPRFGWLATPQTLAYVNGGYTRARFSGVNMTSDGGVSTTFTTQPFSVNGWFVGGGVEAAFDFFGMLGKGWFWRNEYRHASYSNTALPESGTAPATGVNFKPVVQTVTSSVIFKLN